MSEHCTTCGSPWHDAHMCGPTEAEKALASERASHLESRRELSVALGQLTTVEAEVERLVKERRAALDNVASLRVQLNNASEHADERERQLAESTTEWAEHCAKIERERDAALARCAELEKRQVEPDESDPDGWIRRSSLNYWCDRATKAEDRLGKAVEWWGWLADRIEQKAKYLNSGNAAHTAAILRMLAGDTRSRIRALSELTNSPENPDGSQLVKAALKEGGTK